MGLRTWIIGFIVLPLVGVGAYVATAVAVLSNLPADFLLGDYVYERDEPNTYFPLVRPVRDGYFELIGKERIIKRMRTDALLRAVPLSQHLDIIKRFPHRLDRSLYAIRSTYCVMSDFQQVEALKRVYLMDETRKLDGVNLCNKLTLPPKNE